MTARTEATPTTSPDEVSPLGEPTAPGRMSRRRMITVGSFGVVGIVGLAACGSSSSGDASGTKQASGSAAPEPSDSAAPGGAGASSGSGSGGSSTAGTTLTKLSAVPVGGAIGLLVNNQPILVSQPSAGTAAAFSAVCPHQGCTVAAEGTQVMRCPCHGSTFDPKTGKNLSGPAPRPLTAVAVKVDGGNVVLNGALKLPS